MALGTAGELLDTLWQGRLIDPDLLQELAREVVVRSQSAEALTAALVARGALTPFQAEECLAGRGRTLSLGPFRFLDLRGEGALGRVYQAHDTSNGRVVAVKVLHPGILSNREDEHRFHREAETAARLGHPNLVAVLGDGVQGGVHYLVMEDAEGPGLLRFLDEAGPLTPARACRFTRQAALALEHACQRRLVPSRVRPADFIVTANAHAVKFLLAGQRSLGASAWGLGEFEFGALLEPDGDGRSSIALAIEADSLSRDVHAAIADLGSVLSLMLQGGSSRSAPAAGRLPYDLARVLARMKADDPSERYETFHECAQALAPFCDGTDEADLQAERLRRPVDAQASPPPPLGRGVSPFPTLSEQADSATVLGESATPPAPPCQGEDCGGRGGPTEESRRDNDNTSVQQLPLRPSRSNRRWVAAALFLAGMTTGAAGMRVANGPQAASNAEVPPANAAAPVAAALATVPVAPEKTEPPVPEVRPAPEVWPALEPPAAPLVAKEPEPEAPAVAERPEDAGRRDAAEYSRLLDMAERAEKAGHGDEAIALLGQAIQLLPDRTLAYVRRAQRYAAKEAHHEVIEDCSKALSLQPNDALAYRLRASALVHLGDYAGAIADATKAIALRPNDALAYDARGLGHYGRNELRAAVDDLNRAVQIDDTLAMTLGNLAWILATSGDPAVRDVGSALKHATRACELTKWRDPVLLKDLAAAFAASGQFDRAVQYQERALEHVERLPQPIVVQYMETLNRYKAANADVAGGPFFFGRRRNGVVVVGRAARFARIGNGPPPPPPMPDMPPMAQRAWGRMGDWQAPPPPVPDPPQPVFIYRH